MSSVDLGKIYKFFEANPDAVPCRGTYIRQIGGRVECCGLSAALGATCDYSPKQLLELDARHEITRQTRDVLGISGEYATAFMRGFDGFPLPQNISGFKNAYHRGQDAWKIVAPYLERIAK